MAHPINKFKIHLHTNLSSTYVLTSKQKIKQCLERSGVSGEPLTLPLIAFVTATITRILVIPLLSLQKEQHKNGTPLLLTAVIANKSP